MPRLPRLRAAVAVAMFFSVAACAADPAAPTKDEAGAKQLLYIVKHGTAKDLAAVLGAHFKGAAEFQALSDGSGNALVISAAPSALDEVVKVLDLLDRPPQSVAVEIFLVTEAAEKPSDEAPARPRGPGGRAARAQQTQILPPVVQDALQLTADQRKQLAELQRDADAQLDKVLTEEQRQQLRQGRGLRAGGPAVSQEVDEKDFSGPIADVEARLDALQKRGVLAEVKRLRLIAVEGRPVSVTVGGNQPYVSGVTRTATGVAAQMINYRNAGLKADAAVWVSPDKAVTLDLKLDETHPYIPADGILIGADENDKPVFATEFASSSVAAKLEIPSGQARVLEGVKTTPKAEKPHVLVIVGARVVEPDAKAEK